MSLGLTTAGGDLPLHLIKLFPADDRFVGVLHNDPFFLGGADPFFVLVGDLALLVMDAVAYIRLVGQGFCDIGVGP